MRLITRADFDGIACGVLLSAQLSIDRFLFVEPKFMQDHEVAVNPDDLIANLPFHPRCHLWFDHHFTNQVSSAFHGNFRIAPSAARVVYEYFPPGSLSRYEELVNETDRIDSASLEVSDILFPDRYVLLSFTVDPNSRDDEPYWISLINLLREQTFEDVMAHPEVRARCEEVLADFKVYQTLVATHSRQDDNVVITDLRGVDFRGKLNRFLVYCLFPETNVSVKVFKDAQRLGRTGISVGKNIFNNTSSVNVGELLSHFGGGGHQGAGSCRVPDPDVDQALKDIIHSLKAKG